MAEPSTDLRRDPRLQRGRRRSARWSRRCGAAAPLARDPRRRRRIERWDGGRGRGGRARGSSRIRTTRATAPRSRPASARATGDCILIIDGDGQHRPADAARLVSPAGRRTTSSSGRVAGRAQAIDGAARSATPAERSGELSHRAADPRPHVRPPRGAPRAPARVPAPAAERLLDADDDDAGVHQGGLQRAVRADRRRAARGHVEDQAGARRREASS